jgi:cell shape-determining protein MreC
MGEHIELSKRLNQLESAHAKHGAKLENVDVNLEKLSNAYSDMAKTTARLVAHQEEQVRMSQQMRELQQEQYSQSTQIALLQQSVGPLRTMEKQLNSNTGVSNATKWVAGVVISAVIAALAIGLRGVFGG